MRKLILIVVALLLLLSSTGFAGRNAFPKAALHVKSHNAKQTCANLPVIGSCGDVVTTYLGDNVDAFPVFFDLVEYLGVEYGVEWPAAWGTVAFTSCSDLVIGNIVSSGDGVAQTWTSCQTDPVAICGWVWMYAAGPGLVNPYFHPVSGDITVLDCSQGLDRACIMFSGVNGMIGDDPCEPSGIEPSTWGGIKAIFE
jgi:hypothetical protein